MAYIIYNLILLILSPAIVVFLLYRIFVSGKSRKSWRQQMGGVSLPAGIAGKKPIWIHAVSVGESVASAAVVSEVKKSIPEVAVIVSTTTETGQEMAHKFVKYAGGFLYFPFDLVPFVSRSLARVRPAVFASTDTEIWPNFLHIAHKRGVKTAIINGTVSDKTLRGAKKAPWVYRWAMSNIDRFCMQSQADADRIVSLGADPSRVSVTGNCKADQQVEHSSEAEKDELRSRFKFPSVARIFVAGSTNPGEDGPVLDAFLIAREAYPDLRLVIAPRQVERGEEIRELAARKGLAAGRRSSPESMTGAEDVVVLDTFGELAQVYSIADVSFVGGSLIPRGCHSILQPISQGKAVFFGPHTFKAKDLVAQAKSFGVGFQIGSGEELGREMAALLGSAKRLEEIRCGCAEMMKANHGAAKRTANALAELFRSDE